MLTIFHGPINYTLAYLKYYGDRKILCTVGIISIKTAITASSCINDTTSADLRVVSLMPRGVGGDYSLKGIVIEHPIAILLVSFLHKVLLK